MIKILEPGFTPVLCGNRVMVQMVAVQSEMLEALIQVYHTVQKLLGAYDRKRDPNNLDHIIYQVTKLYRLAKLLDAATNDALEQLDPA